MLKREWPHNSEEQVAEYLRSALALVEELDPPSDLREICFAKAVDLTSAKQITMEQPQPIDGRLLRPGGM